MADIFQDGIFQQGIFQQRGSGLYARESGADSASLALSLDVAAALDIGEHGADGASFTVMLPVVGTVVAGETGKDGAAFAATLTIEGVVAASEAGADVATFLGDSDAFVPRDPALGLIHLVEIDAYDPVEDEIVTLRFGTKAFTTRPTDSPANAYFEDGLHNPGDYRRSMFGSGRTGGIGQVGSGEIVIKNPDGRLDNLERYAFDGRRVRILSMGLERPAYSRALPLFDGTMEQATFTWSRVTVLIRDRMAQLDKPLQEGLYEGTTISGGMNEAEGGPDDLKKRPKPRTYGAPRNVPAVESNPFEHVYDIGINGLDDVAMVRDGGVPLTASGNDYSTVADLIGASIPDGQFATQLNEGRIRVSAMPLRQITVDPIAGTQRTAAQVARKILLDMGKVENENFLASDIAELNALNSAEIGLWTGTNEITGINAVGRVLSSIGASIVPDRHGVYRMLRHEVPNGEPVIVLGINDIIDRGRGIERDRTRDEGHGVPVWRVSVNYGFNHSVMNANELDVATSEGFRTFASQEWRTAVAEDEAVRDVHLLSPEMTIETLLIHEADAQAEADRLLAMHRVGRFLLQVPVKSILIEQVELGDVVRMQIPRFGLSGGKDFRVIGMEENFQNNTTTLELWG